VVSHLVGRHFQMANGEAHEVPVERSNHRFVHLHVRFGTVPLHFTHDMIGCLCCEARCAKEITCDVSCLQQASSEVCAFVLFI